MKKVALVLSGGGARGIAHIGVIEKLIENGYTITSIAGTSMGAMVGGIYALGKLDAFKEWLFSLDKKIILKLVDFSFSSQGLIKGEKVFHAINEFIEDAKVEDLDIPFSANACDLINNKEVVFNSGSIYDALRASVSIPLVFKPIKRNNQLLVDGGVVNNIPVKNVKRLKGDRLFVVNVNANIDPIPAKIKLSSEESRKQSIYAKKIKEIQTHIKSLYPVKHEANLGYFNILEKTLMQMMFQMSETTLQQYQPDLIFNISRHSSNTYDFYKAEELVEIGRMVADESLKYYKE